MQGVCSPANFERAKRPLLGVLGLRANGADRHGERQRIAKGLESRESEQASPRE